MTVGTGPRQRPTLAVACMAQGMMVLDVLIVSVALPAMQHELHLLPAGLEWVVSGYALALAALIPTGGALGDHFGRKRIFASGVTLFHACISRLCFVGFGGNADRLPGDPGNRRRRHVIVDPLTDL